MKERLPAWFKQRTPDPQIMERMTSLLQKLDLHTVCESARCPNIGNCFSRKTATFMILGDVCTRNCTFCAVRKGTPAPVDKDEPQHLFEAVEKLGLNHVVITSVTRDDLPDGGASQFAGTIRMLRKNRESTAVEVLVPDFEGSIEALRMVVEAGPQVINHNVETVPRLYPTVRPEANYSRSLEILSAVKRLNQKIAIKSGFMLGLGETKDEIARLMEDLRKADCELLTIGQYLQPSPKHHPVIRFVTPQEFSEYEHIGKDMGFLEVASSPLVRSSFNAGELFAKAKTAALNQQHDGKIYESK